MSEQDNTPQHSQGYGGAEHADDTRQAQHIMANDMPADVNNNASLARFQGLTAGMAADGGRQNSERRHIIADGLLKAAIGS